MGNGRHIVLTVRAQWPLARRGIYDRGIPVTEPAFIQRCACGLYAIAHEYGLTPEKRLSRFLKGKALYPGQSSLSTPSEASNPEPLDSNFEVIKLLVLDTVPRYKPRSKANIF